MIMIYIWPSYKKIIMDYVAHKHNLKNEVSSTYEN